MGANIAVGSPPSFPPDTRGTPTEYIYLLYLMYMDAWLLPGSGERVAASEVGGGR